MESEVPWRWELAGFEREKQGEQRYLVWEQPHQDKKTGHPGYLIPVRSVYTSEPVSECPIPSDQASRWGLTPLQLQPGPGNTYMLKKEKQTEKHKDDYKNSHSLLSFAGLNLLIC